ncbi:Ankyrin repeat protein [Apiospora marii]|uniref:Ankyrin repeat protein n=1 Tax=Apiospora marii TaxID=335849 RepID=UPI00312FBE0B
MASSSTLVPAKQRDVLLDAVSDFQGVLNDEERRELIKMRTLPDSDSIMVFTAELDSTHRARKGPSFASRLHSVLSSVGMFCSIIDTFVSSHPEIAALVWGSVKLTMLVAANVASYYQATSDLFMKLGRMCPLFADYQALYPDSIRLQKALIEFHASIIRCCKHVVQTVQRPVHQQLLTFLVPFDQEFKPDIENLQRHSESVEREISYAKAQADRQDQQLQVLERQEASKSRTLMNHFTGRADDRLRRIYEMELQKSKRTTRKRKQKLLDSLSNREYLRRYKQSCKKRWGDTASWIFQDPDFCRWQDGEESVLWCSGKIGSGKTITTSSVIQHILSCKGPSAGPVSYFFVQPTGSESPSANGILKSILQQRLDPANITDEVETALQRIHRFSDIDDTLETIQQLTPSGASYIIIDGVDDCNKSQRRELLAALSSLVSSSKHLRLFLCGRIGIQDEIQSHFKRLIHLPLDVKATNEDITRYIHDIIDQKIEDDDLRFGDPSLADDVRSTLSKGAQGMFLWAYFQVEEIASKTCDEDIRKALHNLPRDLNDIFNRAIRRILDGNHRNEAQRTFRWVIAARRPLWLMELREAIAIEITQEFSDPARQCNDMDKVALWCENLVEVEEESGVVQFVHHSVRTFLLGTPTDPTTAGFHVGLNEADRELGEVCLTYLDFNDFKRSLTRQAKPVKISPIEIINASSKYGSKLAKLHQTVVGPGSETFDLRRSLDPDGSATVSQVTQTVIKEYPFIRYASEHWVSHTKYIRKRKLKTWTILKRVISSNYSFVELPWSSDMPHRDAAIHWAKRHHHGSILRILWDDEGDHLFKWASDHNDLAFFDVLFEEMDFRTPGNIFIYAASVGHLRSLDELVYSGKVHVNDLIEGKTALVTAVIKGQCDAIDKLMSLGADVNAPNRGKEDSPDGPFFTETPLTAAALRGNLKVFDNLVSYGADYSATEDYNPIIAAVDGGHQLLLEKMLAAGADVNASVGNDTALTRATEVGRLDMVDTLLAAGADDTTTYPPALKRTLPVITKSDEILRRKLLEHEVRLSYTVRLRTLLHNAASSHDLVLLSLLLEGGVKVDAQDATGATALHIAARYGDERVRDILVKKLIQSGASPDACNNAGETALHVAAKYGSQYVARYLIAVSPSLVHRADLLGRTPEAIAVSNNQSEVVGVSTNAHIIKRANIPF